MEYTVFTANVSWYNADEEKHETLTGEGSDQVGLYNWCISQMAILSQFDNIKNLTFMVVEEDTYDTDDEYWYKEVTNNEEEKTKTEGQTEETPEP